MTAYEEAINQLDSLTANWKDRLTLHKLASLTHTKAYNDYQAKLVDCVKELEMGSFEIQYNDGKVTVAINKPVHYSYVCCVNWEQISRKSLSPAYFYDYTIGMFRYVFGKAVNAGDYPACQIVEDAKCLKRIDNIASSISYYDKVMSLAENIFTEVEERGKEQEEWLNYLASVKAAMNRASDCWCDELPWKPGMKVVVWNLKTWERVTKEIKSLTKTRNTVRLINGTTVDLGDASRLDRGATWLLYNERYKQIADELHIVH